MEIGIAVLTLNAKNDLPFLLPPLLRYRVLVVDSSSTDGTPEIAQEMGAEVLSIPRSSFNHGLTRELARKTLGTPIVAMLTQDAYAEEGSLPKLVAPLLEGKASLAYGRQIPKTDNPFEATLRLFNYPAESHVRNLHSKEFGPYRFFFSNSFAAYLNAALDEIGGFPPVLMGEDAVVCARLLHRGHSVAYVAESRVSHSHHHTLRQEFHRYFDIGYVRKEHCDLFNAAEDQKRGVEFAQEFLSALPLRSFPRGVAHLAAKYVGYQLGQRAHAWPVGLKKWCSGQKFYWG